jgi:competence protein ComEC
MNPRLLLPLLAFAGGIGLSAWPLQAQVLSLLAPGVLLPALLHRRRTALQLLLLCLLSAGLGLTWALLRAPRAERTDVVRLANCKRCELIGRVQSVQVGERGYKLRLKAESLKKQGVLYRVSGLVQVNLPLAPSRPPSGAQVKLLGHLSAPLPALNFGAFSYRDYLARQGVFTQFQARQLTLVMAPSDWAPGRGVERVRSRVFSAFAQALPAETAALLGSLVLGEQEAPVSETIQTLFQKAGLQHVLAVSGFQVQLLLLAWLGLARLLRLPRWAAAGSGALLTLFYVALTGFSASVLRAGMVACLGLVAWACFRRIHALQALLVGGWLLLLWRPGLLFEAGFQFSFLATAGLIWGATWLAEQLDFLPLPLATCLGALLAAQLWVLPVQLYHFGAVSLLVIPANLWATLFVSLLTWMTLAGMGLALCSASLWAWGAALLRLVCDVFVAGVAWLAALPIPALEGLFLSGMQVALALLVLLSLPVWDQWHLLSQGLLRSKGALLAGVLLTVPLLSGASVLQQRLTCPLRVTYLYVGQGDAILVEAPGHTLLIDAGPRQQQGEQVWDAGTQHILPYLRRRGIGKIDTAIISHAHLDHYGGFSGLLAEIPIQTFFVPAQSPVAGSYLELLRRIQLKGSVLKFPRQGERLALGPDLNLTFWQGLAEAGHSHLGEDPVDDKPVDDNINNQSLVLRLQHRQLSFLFAGDIEAEAEQALLAQVGSQLKVDIFKIPHHGSDTSSGSAFLQAVMPREAIVSAGVANRFKHPYPEILDRYKQLGSRVWRTDQQGAICVCSQGGRYLISSVQK